MSEYKIAIQGRTDAKWVVFDSLIFKRVGEPDDSLYIVSWGKVVPVEKDGDVFRIGYENIYINQVEAEISPYADNFGDMYLVDVILDGYNGNMTYVTADVIRIKFGDTKVKYHYGSIEGPETGKEDEPF